MRMKNWINMMKGIVPSFGLWSEDILGKSFCSVGRGTDDTH